MSRPENFRSLLRSFSRSPDPVECRPTAWVIALVPQTLSRSLFEPLRTSVVCGPDSDHSLPTGPCLDSVLDDLRALSYRFSLTRFWVEVSLSFVPVSWQRLRIPPPLLLGLRAFLYRPYQRENNRNGRQLYPVRAARFYLVRTAPHRLRCERLFVFAGCSTKEILKTSVSFWLRNSI